MARFLIEVPHDGSTEACVRTIELFLRTGSYFLAQADWGCKDGEHKAWFTIEVGTKDEARAVVPAEYRPIAKIVQLNTFSQTEIADLLRRHGA